MLFIHRLPMNCSAVDKHFSVSQPEITSPRDRTQFIREETTTVEVSIMHGIRNHEEFRYFPNATMEVKITQISGHSSSTLAHRVNGFGPVSFALSAPFAPTTLIEAVEIDHWTGERLSESVQRCATKTISYGRVHATEVLGTRTVPFARTCSRS